MSDKFEFIIENNLATNASYSFFIKAETSGNITAFKEFKITYLKPHNGAPYFPE